MRTQVLDPGITAPAGVSVLDPHRHVAGCIGHEWRRSNSQLLRIPMGLGVWVRGLPTEELGPSCATASIPSQRV
jgi:hypothetical protein